MTDLLLDLETAVRKSGLQVVVLPQWKTTYSNGAFKPQGVDIHHTGSYDDVGDTSSDLAYARWLALTGRPDLPPPLANLGLSAEGVVYVLAAGNANHAGEARASGPMPAAKDGSSIYIGIEAYNDGSQGWGTKGKDAAGNDITQYEAYVRLCAALCLHYGWPASHVRGHKETSVTGKWDPGLIDMDNFRADVARTMEEMEDPMADPKVQETLAAILRQSQATRKLVKAVAEQVDVLGDAVAANAATSEDIKKRITKSKRDLAALIQSDDA